MSKGTRLVAFSGTALIGLSMLSYSLWQKGMVKLPLTASVGKLDPTIQVHKDPTSPTVALSRPKHITIRSSSMSSNWAGLVDQSGKDSQLQARWHTPRFVSSATTDQSIAEWIGLGGSNSSALIQIGTMTAPNQTGDPVTRAFWEVLPASAVESVTIPAGSKLSASIVPDGTDSWQMTLDVTGTGRPLIKKVIHLTPSQAASIETSADFITEVPTTGHAVAQLAPVAKTVMTHLKVNGQNVSSVNTQSLQKISLWSQTQGLLATPTLHGSSDSLAVKTVYGGSLPQPAVSNNVPGSGNSEPGGASPSPWPGSGSNGWGPGDIPGGSYGYGYGNGSGGGYGYGNGSGGSYGYNGSGGNFPGSFGGGGYSPSQYGDGWGY